MGAKRKRLTWAEHFRDAKENENQPIPILNPKMEPNESIIKYKVMIDHPCIWSPVIKVISDGKEVIYQSSSCWCAICNDRWRYKSTTTSNIIKHSRNKHEVRRATSEYSISQDTCVPKDIDQYLKNIKYDIKEYILLSARPYSDIENESLNKHIKLMTRDKFEEEAKQLAVNIMEKIKTILQRAESISISIDEWQDREKRRYLGVTCQTIIDGVLRNFTLAHRLMEEIEITGKVIAKHLLNILVQYDIINKIKCAVSDNGGACPATFNNHKDDQNDPNDQENEEINLQPISDIIRFPCLCHVLNIFIKHFIGVDPLKSKLDQIEALRNKIDTSKFITYMTTEIIKYNQKNEKKPIKYRSVPSYTKIRWYSLGSVLLFLYKMKDIIINWYTLNKWDAIKKEVWDSIRIILPIFLNFNYWIEKIEGNSFGQISHGLPCMRMMNKLIHKLTEQHPEFIDPVKEFDSVYLKYWQSFNTKWDPILCIASRLNPYIDHDKCMEKIWIKTADDFIINALSSKLKDPLNMIDHAQNESQDEFDVGYQKKKKSNEDITAHTILAKYAAECNSLSDSVEGKDDLFIFWTRNKTTELSLLSEIAFDYLSILGSSCSTERQFSVTGNILGLRRLSMTGKTLESQAIISMNPEIAKEIYPRMNNVNVE